MNTFGTIVGALVILTFAYFLGRIVVKVVKK